MPLEPGDKAPDFALPDQEGKTVKLSSFKGRKVLVYFYPKADTPGCTKQACSLRDVAGEIGDTAVVGISVAVDVVTRARVAQQARTLEFLG